MTLPVLRPYQAQLRADILAAWASGARSVLAVAPTGSGKTVLMAHLMQEERGASIAIAHRQELVSQISVALARNGVRHRVIGSSSLARTCVSLHMAGVGRSYYDPTARVAVAGVDTLIRMDAADPWFRQVTLQVTDEAHHLLEKNKWGKAFAMFPNARMLGVTATPTRADGQGLGLHADGVVEAMALAPPMRDLIRAGYLTDYRIFAPPSDIDLSAVSTTAGGDFSPEPLRAAVHASTTITGDVVAHYLRIAPSKLGVTFAVDVASATELAAAFRAAGVPSEVVSGKTPDLLRAAILRRFARGELKQLCSVDIFGEGFDLPAIEVVSMARPTQSYGLFVQQFGRSLRPMEGKPYAIVIDHVGNVHRHGLPDAPRVWTLDRREKRGKNTPTDVIPVRTCPKCLATYERTHRACPYCGFYPIPAGRSGPEQVDGDLAELSLDALARLRGEILAADGPPAVPWGAGPEIVGAINKRHQERMEAQARLRERMALWGGARTEEGWDVATAQRLFYLRYGVDVATAQTLNRAESESLMARIVLT